MVSKTLSNLGCLTHEITLSPGSNYIGKIWGFTARFSDLQWKQMPPNELKMTFVRTQYCKSYIFSDTHTYIQEYILITDTSFFHCLLHIYCFGLLAKPIAILWWK